MSKEFIVFGTSDPLDVGLTNNGAAFPGTGLDVSLEIEKYTDGVYSVVEDPPTVDWLSAAAGTVRVTGTETLALGNYAVRYKITNGAQIGRIPNGEKSDLWTVVPVGNV